LKERRVEVYRKPANPSADKNGWTYADVKHFKMEQKVSLLAFPKVTIPASEMIP